MITDPAYPTQRDNRDEPRPGFSKLEEASLRIFCAALQTPGLIGGPVNLEGYMDGCIASAKTLLTKIEAAQK